jgi:lauroyl/myristoyl acyltransferase
MQAAAESNVSHGALDASVVPAAATSGVTRPGEFIHYYTNLLSLFGNERPAAEIRASALAASELRVQAMDAFSERLQSVKDDFSQQRAASGRRPERMPEPVMQGWDAAPLEEIVRTHGGALVALFHYGEHRQVFVDLPSLGVPYIAPVAKHAYFDCCEMLKDGPEPFAHAMSLIEVEDSRVGRKLFSALRQGRIGLIYVDGNMGPDGHLVEEGGVRIGFLGKRIRVKAGIARLAIGLGLPILPLFASVRDGRIHVQFKPLIAPPGKSDLADGEQTDAALTSIMQSLYDALGDQVRQAPEHWEFAFCFHRWLDQREAVEVAREACELPALDLELTVDTQRVTEFRRESEVFWIHVGRQRAYRLPDWAGGLHARLETVGVTVADSMAFLRRAGALPGQARELVAGLLRLGLLEPLSVTA